MFVLMPGETLSINQLTGERTEAKGFKPAPAIVDGKQFKRPDRGVAFVSFPVRCTTLR